MSFSHWQGLSNLEIGVLFVRALILANEKLRLIWSDVKGLISTPVTDRVCPVSFFVRRLLSEASPEAQHTSNELVYIQSAVKLRDGILSLTQETYTDSVYVVQLHHDSYRS